MWEEYKHPRDEDGKFTDGNGTPAEQKRLKEIGIDNNNKEDFTLEIARLEEQLKPVKTEILSVIDKNGNTRYLTRGYNNQNQLIIKLTDNPEEALSIKNRNGLEFKQKLIDKGYKNNYAFIEKNNLSYTDRENIKDKIEAYKNGFKNVYDYKAYLKEKKDAKNKILEENFNNSFIGKNKRQKDLGIIDGEFDYRTFAEVLTRYAKKELGADEIHTSSKTNSKFDSSVYLKVGDNEVRISNHKLPETAEREDRQSNYGTRWNNELILDQTEMRKISNLKTKDEFLKYIKNLFE